MNKFITSLATSTFYRQQQQAIRTITINNSPHFLQSIPQQQRPMSTQTNQDDNTSFPTTKAINTKLTTSFNPTHLEVINESHMHNVPPNSETHFKVVVVSSKFNDAKGLVQRHRMINGVLSEELGESGSVHALSIVAKTPEQWEKMESEGKTKIAPSPNCRGGDGSLPPKNANA